MIIGVVVIKIAQMDRYLSIFNTLQSGVMFRRILLPKILTIQVFPIIIYVTLLLSKLWLNLFPLSAERVVQQLYRGT